MDKLEGLELRIAALEAAGWKCAQRTSPKTGETVYYVIANGKSDRFYYHTEADAWQHAPAVESSVDEALQWLTFDNYEFWNLIPNAGAIESAHFVEINARIPMKYGIQYHVVLSVRSDVCLAVAMCQAYLQYKAGA